MTVGELIKEVDYDCILWRVTAPRRYQKLTGEKDIFSGYAKSEGGKLFPLDCDTYFEDDVVVSYKVWSEADNEKYEVKRGLTVVVETEWYGDD